MVSQAELRAKSLTSSGGTDRTQKARQQSIQRKQESAQQEQQKAESQKSTLQSKIQEIQSKLNSTQAELSQSPASKRLQAERNSLRAELGSLQSAYSQIEKGGYYSNLNEILSSASQAGQASASQTILANKPSESVIPKGAKVLNIKDGVITYEIPASTKAGVTSPSTTTSTTQVTTTSTESSIKKDSNIIKDVGTAISSFGAGIGNVLQGRDFGTSIKTNTGEILFPSGTPELVNIPSNAQPVLTLGEGGKGTQIVYTTPTATYNSQGQIIQSSQPSQYSPIQSSSSIYFTDTTSKLPSVSESQRQINNFVTSETKRYQNLGYTKKQSEILAKESVSRGGMSFSPEGSKEILIKEQGVVGYYSEEIPKQVTGNIIGFVDKEETDVLDKPLFGGWLGKYVEEKGGKIPTTLSFFSFPSKKLDENIESYKEYSASDNNLFSWGLSDEQKKDEGIKARGRFYREEVFAPAVRTAPYFIPIASELLLTSDIAKGIQQIKNPEDETKIIDRAVEKVWTQYNLDYAKAKEDLEEGYELEAKLTKEEIKKQVTPEILNQIRTQGASSILWGGIGLGISGAGALVNKFVPRQKYFGLTGSEYKKVGKQVGEQLNVLGSQDIKWIGSIDEGTKAVKIIGSQTYDDLSRQFFATGNLKVTESGKVLLPEAQGFSFFSGTAKVGKDKTIGIVGGELFETGAKSGGKLIGSIDDIDVYKLFGESTTIPRVSTYALYNPSKVSQVAIRKQVGENILFGGQTTKEFFPSWALGFGGDVSKRVVGDEASRLFFDVSPTSTGFSIVKSAPSKVNVIQPADIIKTPFSKTFGLQEQIPFLTRGIATPKAVGIKATTTDSFLNLGGITTFAVSDVKVTSKADSSFVTIKNKPSEIEALYLQPIQEAVVETKTKVREATQFKQPVKERDFLSSFVQPAQSQIQSPIQSQQPRQAQKTQQKQVLSLVLTPRPQIKTKVKTPTTPKPRIPLLNLGGKWKQIKVQPKEESFEIFGRRFGKDILLKSVKTKKEAGEIFTKFAKGGLGRSGFIESEGKRLSLDEFNLGYEFAPAKRDAGRIVQKAKFSLGTGAEVSEIQYFKRKGSKTKRSNLFFGSDGKWK